MPLKRHVSPALPILVLTLAALFEGCSLLFLHLHASDKEKVETASLDYALQLTELTPGTPLAIYLQDGSLIAGIFAGFAPIPEKTYAARYQQFREQFKSSHLFSTMFPAWREKLRLLRDDGETVRGQFAGFNFGPRIVLLMNEETRTWRQSFSLDSFVRMDGETTQYSLDNIKTYLVGLRVPLLSRISLIPAEGQRLLLEWQDIQYIELPDRQGSLFGKFAIGILLDIVSLIILTI